MKIKHISMIVLLWMMTIQATAQQVKWMNPMDGDEPYICGRPSDSLPRCPRTCGA